MCRVEKRPPQLELGLLIHPAHDRVVRSRCPARLVQRSIAEGYRAEGRQQDEQSERFRQQ